MQKTQFKARHFLTVITMLCLMTAPAQLFAQEESSERPFKAQVNLGYGISISDNMAGMGQMAHARYQTRFGLIGLQYMQIQDNVDRYGYPTTYLVDYTEIGLSYGHELTLGMFSFSPSIGMGVFWAEETTPLGPVEFNNFSFPVQASLTVRPFSIVGIGVQASRNFNTRRPISTAMLVLEVGRF